jgi:hypothetical protein
MVSLVGYVSNILVYFFGVFIAVVRVEVLDLTSELRLNDRYYNLPLVSNVEPGHVCSDARFF